MLKTVSNYSINHWMATRHCNNESIIYNLKEHTILILSGSASLIWQEIRKNYNFKILIQELRKIFHVSIQELQRDTQEFLFSLAERNIIKIEEHSGRVITGFVQSSSVASIKSQKDVKFLELEKEISIKMADKKQLFNVMFELTYNCNLECRHCYAINCKRTSSEKNELSTEKWKSIIDELYSMNAFLITFSGGDPFIRKDFMEIFQYARKKDFVCNIFTNGNLMTEEIINEISDLYPRSVQMSIYSSREEVHDSITQVRGSWKKSMQALEKCHSKNILIGLKSPLMKLNVKYYKEMIQFAKQFDASLQMDLMITAKNDGNLAPLGLRVDDESDIFNIVSDPEVDGYYKEYKRQDFISDKDPELSICGAGGNGFAVNPYGVVNICTGLQYPIGNLNKQSIKEIWNESESLKYFRKIKWKDVEDCKDCEITRYCIFCPGTSFSETGEMLKKSSYNCRIASCRAKYFERKGGDRNEI